MTQGWCKTETLSEEINMGAVKDMEQEVSDRLKEAEVEEREIELKFEKLAKQQKKRLDLWHQHE